MAESQVIYLSSRPSFYPSLLLLFHSPQGDEKRVGKGWGLSIPRIKRYMLADFREMLNVTSLQRGYNHYSDHQKKRYRP